MSTSMSRTAAPQAPAKAAPKWGDLGVSERFYVQDTAQPIQQAVAPLTLQQAGILSELQHHFYLTVTGTHGTGTNVKDTFGPYNLLNNYIFRAGSNTPLVYLSGRGLEVINIMEFPVRNWAAYPIPQTPMNPLTNLTDMYSYPIGSASASFGPTVARWWQRVPLAIKWAGMPGGAVGYIVLQNKAIANVVQPTFAVSGTSVGSTTALASPYLLTGNDTVTFTAGNYETWKSLWTVPADRSQMPIFGFVRYLTEVQQAYSGTSFTYTFEPGGVLLRAAVTFVDATVNGGMATSNLNNIAYQYGSNKQLDVYTPYRNIHEQIALYGRPLPQGTFVFDYYTDTRTLVNAKSTENTANVQLLANFASGYTVPANSYALVVLDKVYIAQNYLAGA